MRWLGPRRRRSDDHPPATTRSADRPPGSGRDAAPTGPPGARAGPPARSEGAPDGTHHHESAPERSGSTHPFPTAPERRRPGRRPVPVAASLALAAVVGLGAVAVDGTRNGGDESAVKGTLDAGRRGHRVQGRRPPGGVAVGGRQSQRCAEGGRGRRPLQDDGHDHARRRASTGPWPSSRACAWWTHVKDAAGRPGVGLTFEGSPKGYAWVFDSSSLVRLGTIEAALLDVGVADKKGAAPVSSS